MLPGHGDATGPAALDNDGNEIKVIRHVPHYSIADGDALFTREVYGGRVGRLDLQTSP